MLNGIGHAQISSTSLRGSVTDSTGALVLGAKVTLHNPATGTDAAQTTDRQLTKKVTDGAEQFPGQPASYSIRDNTKGLAGGYTWSPTANLINDVRYGYIRQGYGNRGVGSGNYVDFRFVDQFNAETRTTIVDVPMHNIVDNLSWSKGSHTVQLGGNWRFITNHCATDSLSYSVASTNPYWLNTTPDPGTVGVPTYQQGFTNSFQIA